MSAGVRFSDRCEMVISAGVDGRRPDSPQTGDGRFLIASITKTFVGAEVSALAHDGALSLDDTIDKWLPDMPNADRITVQQLLTHTSGLGDIVDSAPWRDALLADLSKIYSLEDALAVMQPTAAYAPGHYAYANVNHTIAAIIVEKVTGQSLSDALSARFLVPLGLTHTTVGTIGDHRTLEHGWFTLEDNAWGGIQGERTSFDASIDRDQDTASFPGLETVLSVTEAHGGMVSTVHDVLAWGAALADGSALGGATNDFFLPTHAHLRVRRQTCPNRMGDRLARPRLSLRTGEHRQSACRVLLPRRRDNRFTFHARRRSNRSDHHRRPREHARDQRRRNAHRDERHPHARCRLRPRLPARVVHYEDVPGHHTPATTESLMASASSTTNDPPQPA